MRSNRSTEFLIWVTLAVVTAAAIAVALFVQPYMESQTYNKLTGAHTTMWDALWVELRVQESPR